MLLSHKFSELLTTSSDATSIGALFILHSVLYHLQNLCFSLRCFQVVSDTSHASRFTRSSHKESEEGKDEFGRRGPCRCHQEVGSASKASEGLCIAHKIRSNRYVHLKTADRCPVSHSIKSARRVYITLCFFSLKPLSFPCACSPRPFSRSFAPCCGYCCVAFCAGVAVILVH
jgi:hypothetical protein